MALRLAPSTRPTPDAVLPIRPQFPLEGSLLSIPQLAQLDVTDLERTSQGMGEAELLDVVRDSQAQGYLKFAEALARALAARVFVSAELRNFQQVSTSAKHGVAPNTSKYAARKVGKEMVVKSGSGKGSDIAIHAPFLSKASEPRVVDLVRQRLLAQGVPLAIVEKSLPPSGR